jgi:hypothetical protein
MDMFFTNLIGAASLIDFVSIVAFFSDDELPASIVLVLLLGGPAFYIFTYMRYRNVDKRHIHETETPAQMSNLQQYDNFIEHRTRQRSRAIGGANDSSVTGSLMGSNESADGSLGGQLLDMMSNGTITMKESSGSFLGTGRKGASISFNPSKRRRG